MNIKTVMLLLVAITFSHSLWAESKRIEVYALGQNYLETQPGDTLSGIAEQLLPNNPRMQQQLMQKIIELNPDAFPANNPDFMLSHKRLLLPGEYNKRDSKVDSSKFTVETYSWGNIKRLKR